jgi:uncharacterized protein (TIGR02246 family)
MSAHTPEECDRLFAEAFSAGDVEAILALYEPGAKFVPQSGQAAIQGDALKQVLEQFLSLKATFDIQTESILQTSDIALLRSTWKLIGTAPDGQRVEMANRSIEVVRKQNDGTWKYVIDNPFGGV